MRDVFVFLALASALAIIGSGQTTTLAGLLANLAALLLGGYVAALFLFRQKEDNEHPIGKDN